MPDIPCNNTICNIIFNQKWKNLKFIEKALKVKINARGNDISIHGEADDVELTRRLLQELYFLIESNHPIYHNEIDYAIKMIEKVNGYLKQGIEENVNFEDSVKQLENLFQW